MTQSPETNTVKQDHWDGSLYRNMCSFSPLIGSNLVKYLAPQPHERILDFGCGTGKMTAQIAKHGSRVVGLDPSGEMLRVAREKHPSLTFIQGDALSYSADKPFNAIFSNDVLHWIPEPQAELQALNRMLVSGGRMVAEFGGEGNIARIRTELHEILAETGYKPEELDPWYFPGRKEYARILNESGFQVQSIRLFEKNAQLKGQEGLRLWLAMFASKLFSPLSELERETVVRKLENRLYADLFAGGKWKLNYRRLRFRVQKDRKEKIYLGNGN